MHCPVFGLKTEPGGQVVDVVGVVDVVVVPVVDVVGVVDVVVVPVVDVVGVVDVVVVPVVDVVGVVDVVVVPVVDVVGVVDVVVVPVVDVVGVVDVAVVLGPPAGVVDVAVVLGPPPGVVDVAVVLGPPPGVVEVVVVLLPLGEAAAWAGTITDLTIGFVHLDGNNTAVATPPIVKIFRIWRRSCRLPESILPPVNYASLDNIYHKNSKAIRHQINTACQFFNGNGGSPAVDPSNSRSPCEVGRASPCQCF